MQLNELYTKLVEAYSEENLNRITGNLISLYKSKNYGTIREIANKVSEFINIDEDNDAKCFSRLIVLYHPDKGEYINKTIENLYQQKDLENLKKYAHILSISEIENVSFIATDENIEFNPEYVWDIQADNGFNITDFNNDVENNYQHESSEYERSFFNLIKIREYGKIDIELPTYYLEDFEEFEMAYSGLESLSGVEYCKHIKILDVSNNAISEISDLRGLNFIEELYLSNNQIGYIDVLSNLVKLRILDLSGNEIDDITPIMYLNELEYVNLLGNKIPAYQIEILEKKAVVIIFEKE